MARKAKPNVWPRPAEEVALDAAQRRWPVLRLTRLMGLVAGARCNLRARL